jgi:environmental stress-induced protein Ves
MDARLLAACEYRRMRWKNNLGWTREVHQGRIDGAGGSPREGDRGDSSDWDWRVSIAEIDHDCAFSAFPGHERILVLLSGNGMRLRFADGRVAELDPPHDRVAFRGEESLACELRDGPTRDFNLIWKRDRVRAELMHRPLVGPMLFFPEAGVEWLAYLVSGRAHLKDRPGFPALDAGDSLLLGTRAGDEGRLILDGGGELLLVRIGSVA